jgi:hypothetical protein
LGDRYVAVAVALGLVCLVVAKVFLSDGVAALLLFVLAIGLFGLELKVRRR